jgi:hypothetical protein
MALASNVSTELHKSGPGCKPSCTECSGLFFESVLTTKSGDYGLRRPRQVFCISYNLYCKLCFSVFVSKGSKFHVLFEVVLIHDISLSRLRLEERTCQVIKISIGVIVVMVFQKKKSSSSWNLLYIQVLNKSYPTFLRSNIDVSNLERKRLLWLEKLPGQNVECGWSCFHY